MYGVGFTTEEGVGMRLVFSNIRFKSLRATQPKTNPAFMHEPASGDLSVPDQTASSPALGTEPFQAIDRHRNAYSPLERALLDFLHEAERAKEQGRWRDALHFLDSADALCTAYCLDAWKSHIAMHRGIAMTRLEQWSSAIEVLLPLVVHPPFRDDPTASYEILHCLAICTHQMGQLKLTETFLRFILNMLDRSDVRWIHTHLNLAGTYELMGEHEKAFQHYVHAAESARRLGNTHLEAWALIGLSATQLEQGSTQDVECMLNHAAKLAESLHDAVLDYAIQHNRFVLKRVRQDFENFLHLYSTLVERVPNDEYRAKLWEEKILYDIMIHDWHQAESDLGEALQLPLTTPTRAQLLRLAGECYLQQQQWDRAESYLWRAVEALRACGSVEVYAVIRQLQWLRVRQHSEEGKGR